MKLSKLSFVLILFAWGVVLNASGLRANGSTNQDSVKYNPTSLPANGQQQKKANAQTTSTQASPSVSTEPIIPVDKPTSDLKTASPQSEPVKSCEWWRQSLSCFWMSLNFGTVPDWGLFVIAIVTARFALRSLRDISIQAKSSKESADAAVAASMPVLSPLIVGGTLHPLPTTAEIIYPSDQPKMFESSVHFVFENFGKTPGIIREVRADLFLCEKDQFPTVNFGQLPLVNYQPIVAGDSRGENALMAVAECVKSVTATPKEFTELLASADNNYRRFAFIGHVIYDDFFDNRHTRRFCVKLRLMDKGFFQLVRGGKAYNHVEWQKIPKEDPL